MALIGQIRKQGWLLITMMILALGGFILMDVITNAERSAAGDVNTLGRVNGKEIKRNEFDNYEKLIYANSQGSPFQVREQIWKYFVEDAIISQEAEALGLGVSKEELVDLQFGNNLSPIIVERFRGQDGQPNRATLSSIKAAIEQGSFTDPVNRSYWATQEKEIVKDRLQGKITSMVLKGVYTPQWQAEMAFRENNQRIDFAYVRIPYEKINDSEVQLTDDDYAAYLKENPRLFDEKEEIRSVSYVAIDVYPTAGDSAATRDAAARLIEGLRAAPNDSVYIVSNNGNYDKSYRTKDNLPASVADTLLQLPLGSIVGPFMDQGAWALAKIIDRKVIPDSVKARHILLREATPANEQRIDSLLTLLNTKKATFDSLAIQNSQDGSASKGGDLGWFADGAMVPEFNNICFYEGVQGKYYKVATQFGWHLIEITGKKFIKNATGVRAAYISQPIEPSTQTQQVAKDRALAMVQQAKTLDDLNSIAGKENLPVQNSGPVRANDYVLGALNLGDDSREVIRWAFDKKTKENTVAKEIFSFRDPNGGYFDSKYVVAALKSITPPGSASVATLKASPRAELEVRNRKKAEMLKAKLQTAGDLLAAAGQWGVSVDTAKGASMLQTFLPNGGSEPRIVGLAFSVAKDATSKPAAGSNGVYIVKPLTAVADMPLPPDLNMFRRQVNSSANAGIRMNLMNSLVKEAETKDFRSRFF